MKDLTVKEPDIFEELVKTKPKRIKDRKLTPLRQLNKIIYAYFLLCGSLFLPLSL